MTNNIAINGRCFGRPITGVERYAREISQRLGIRARTISPRNSSSGVRGHLWEQLVLPRRVRTEELLWSPANAGPWVVNRQIAALHDASVFDHPQWFRASYAAWTRLSFRMLAHLSRALITLSEFSGARLSKHVPRAAAKLRVIMPGVGSPFEPQSRASIQDVRSKHALVKPYFIFVGTPQPRKNISLLVTAWQRSCAESHALVLCGGANRLFANSKPAASVGYVADEDLPGLYAGATAFVTASHYEGSCLPALEAMACGTPVIAPNSTVFPELLGESALLFEANDVEPLAAALRCIIDDKRLANNLRARGLEHAAQFSWDKAAEAHLRLFDSI